MAAFPVESKVPLPSEAPSSKKLTLPVGAAVTVPLKLLTTVAVRVTGWRAITAGCKGARTTVVVAVPGGIAVTKIACRALPPLIPAQNTNLPASPAARPWLSASEFRTPPPGAVSPVARILTILPSGRAINSPRRTTLTQAEVAGVGAATSDHRAKRHIGFAVGQSKVADEWSPRKEAAEVCCGICQCQRECATNRRRSGASIK